MDASLTLVASNSLAAGPFTWQRSAVRTVGVVSGFTGRGYGVRIERNQGLTWSGKVASDVLDFTLDLTAWLNDDCDSLLRATVGFDDTTLIQRALVLTSSMVTVWLGGGSPGGTSMVTVAASTFGGRAAGFAVALPIAASGPPAN